MFAKEFIEESSSDRGVSPGERGHGDVEVAFWLRQRDNHPWGDGGAAYEAQAH